MNYLQKTQENHVSENLMAQEKKTPCTQYAFFSGFVSSLPFHKKFHQSFTNETDYRWTTHEANILQIKSSTDESRATRTHQMINRAICILQQSKSKHNHRNMMLEQPTSVQWMRGSDNGGEDYGMKLPLPSRQRRISHFAAGFIITGHICNYNTCFCCCFVKHMVRINRCLS